MNDMTFYLEQLLKLFRIVIRGIFTQRLKSDFLPSFGLLLINMIIINMGFWLNPLARS